jgi:hypothetical protein
MGRRHTPLRYSTPPISDARIDDIGLRLRRMYRRLFHKEPALKSSATEWFVRELEYQEIMKAEICRALLAEQLEFHNEPGRPAGSKTKKRRKPLLDETKITGEAKRQRRSRARKA